MRYQRINWATRRAARGSQIVDTSSGRLPAGDVVMRIGWAETQEPTDAIFTRDDNHPDDGASVGTVSGLNPPVFPPALNSDGGLYMLVWDRGVGVSGGGRATKRRRRDVAQQWATTCTV